MKKLASWLRSIIQVIFFALLLVPVLDLPLYIEVNNAVTPGVVVGKREEITMRRLFWSRRLFLNVRYQPVGASTPQLAAIAVDAQHYDRTPLGAPAQVRYLPRPDMPWLSSIAARLEDQPPLGPLRALLSGARTWIIVIAIWLALLAAYAKWRRYSLALPILAVFIGGGLYFTSNWPAPAPPGPQLAARATIQATHDLDTLTRGLRGLTPLRAARPYTLVELSFVPAGMAGPVVTVDMVDAGSVAGLEPGANVPIRYSAAEVR